MATCRFRKPDASGELNRPGAAEGERNSVRDRGKEQWKERLFGRQAWGGIIGLIVPPDSGSAERTPQFRSLGATGGASHKPRCDRVE